MLPHEAVWLEEFFALLMLNPRAVGQKKLQDLLNWPFVDGRDRRSFPCEPGASAKKRIAFITGDSLGLGDLCRLCGTDELLLIFGIV